MGIRSSNIYFNRVFLGFLDVLKVIEVLYLSANTLPAFAEFDKNRIIESQRHSLPRVPSVKVIRKKNKMLKKGKLSKAEKEEGLTYKSGEF
jgi:hypothetical protein